MLVITGVRKKPEDQRKLACNAATLLGFVSMADALYRAISDPRVSNQHSERMLCTVMVHMAVQNHLARTWSNDAHLEYWDGLNDISWPKWENLRPKERNKFIRLLVDSYATSCDGSTHNDLRGIFKSFGAALSTRRDGVDPTLTERTEEAIFSVDMFVWRALEHYDRRQLMGGQLRS